MKRIILPGLLAGLVMLIINWLFGQVLISALWPSLQIEYQNPFLFRSWSDPLMSLIFVQPFLVGLLLAWVWDKVKQLFTSTSVWVRGLNFGLAYWVVTSIPGMLISYSSFPLSLGMVLSWTAAGLVQAIFGCALLAKLNK